MHVSMICGFMILVKTHGLKLRYFFLEIMNELKQRPVIGNWPLPRCGCACTLLENNVILFHGGSEKQTVFNDVWELTINSLKDVRVSSTIYKAFF